MTEPHVVIAGAGFAGLYTAQGLADAPLRITVVDRAQAVSRVRSQYETGARVAAATTTTQSTHFTSEVHS